jgi:hypothetical protein
VARPRSLARVRAVRPEAIHGDGAVSKRRGVFDLCTVAMAAR